MCTTILTYYNNQQNNNTQTLIINTIEAGQALREDAPDVREKIEKAVQEEPQSQQLPLGIPPSVSYSPDKAATNGDVGNGLNRPDPPEAPGVTGYRQPPLRYSVENGRGGQDRRKCVSRSRGE